MKSKISLLFLILLILLSTVAQAETADREQIKALLVSMDAVNNMQRGINQQIEKVAQTQPEKANRLRELFDKLGKQFLEDNLITVYARAINTDEAKQLTQFLESEVGKKFLNFSTRPYQYKFNEYFTPEEQQYLESQVNSIGLDVLARVSKRQFQREAYEYMFKALEKEVPDMAEKG